MYNARTMPRINCLIFLVFLIKSVGVSFIYEIIYSQMKLIDFEGDIFMNQFTVLRQMFDVSMVIEQHGTIMQAFSTNTSFLENVERFQHFTDYEQATFQTSIFQKLQPHVEKQTFLQVTWNNRRVLTYVIASDNQYIIAYNILKKENAKKEALASLNSEFIIKSDAMKEVLSKVLKSAQASGTTLLLGESGVGKEVAARTIHKSGLRKDQPFIAINCGALPETLIESELFGYVAGAFTDAHKSGKIGKFREANHGVIFLDEVGELPLTMQVKLLRVLQERIVTPIGSSKEYKIDVQIIAATNKSLIQMVEDGTFREDLFYRLNIIPIVIPPLRHRIEEIPELITHFNARYNEKYHFSKYFSTEAIDFLSLQEWPGNVRELENFVERAIILADESLISIQTAQEFLNVSKSKPAHQDFTFHTLMPLQEAQELVEEQLISMAMEQYNSLKLASKVLGISQPTMSRKYKKIKEAQAKQDTGFSTRIVLEKELDKRLRATAVVTSIGILPIDLERAIAHLGDDTFLAPVSEQLTQVYMKEVGVQWGFIFIKNKAGQIVNLTASEDFIIPNGVVYIGSEVILQTIEQAYNGIISVTPIYMDEYGEWKTCCAPLYDTKGQIIAILGFDYAKDYVESELIKLSESLNIQLS